jgi:ABC-type proline/glycine betaine transport system ATPase subunit
MGEAFALADRVGVLSDGRLAALAAPQELLRSADPEVKIFLDALPQVGSR